MASDLRQKRACRFWGVSSRQIRHLGVCFASSNVGFAGVPIVEVFMHLLRIWLGIYSPTVREKSPTWCWDPTHEESESRAKSSAM